MLRINVVISALFKRFMQKPTAVSVLIVCMENICRSPMAEGALKQALSKRGLSYVVKVESAGTHVSRPGSRPDVRAVRVAQSRGINISGIRSRIVKTQDFHEYDYILAVDNKALASLAKRKIDHANCKIMTLMSFVKNPDTIEIPDPYFGNNAGFERVMDLVELAAEEIVSTLLNNNSWGER
jgi:protein-tyrosine phosphatase